MTLMTKSGVWDMRHDAGFQFLESTGVNAEIARQLTQKARDQLLKELGEDHLTELFGSWYFLGRSEQLPPTTNFRFWMYMAGRGAGKTRTGAEWCRGKIMSGCSRGALIAPTAADSRDVMVEGESGLLNVCRPWDRDHLGNIMGKPLYEPSKRRVTWENGAMVTLYSADEPERLRGPQHQFAWMDELGAWKRPETFDMAMFGMRLGKMPQVFISTTPRQTKLIRRIYKKCVDPDEPRYQITRGGTISNIHNLSPDFVEELEDQYGGTQLGKQELDGVLVDQLEGALWSLKLLEESRKDANLLHGGDFYFERIVMGVDPATTNKDDSDSTGIVIVGLGNDRNAYVLCDATMKGTPEQWGAEVAKQFKRWQVDKIIAEVNQGGDLVKSVLTQIDPMLGPAIKTVHASVGKKARAEPVSQRYEQGRVKHVGVFDELEEQMITWEPLESTYSPDRIDALVWAVTELLPQMKKKGGDKPWALSRMG